jgi:hypothetical protein
MILSPPVMAGVALFFAGSLLFCVQLFRHRGIAKGAQLRVLGELFSGAHGPQPRAHMRLGVLMVAVGAVFLFAGVAASDRERARRCDAHCRAAGFRAARIGPNADRDPKDRSTWFVACICEGGEGAPLEVDANGLLAE